MHLIEEIIDAVLSPFEAFFSQIDERMSLILAFIVAIFSLLLLPIRISMLVSDIQDQLNTISTLINTVQWLLNGISEISQVYSTISNVTSSAMDLNIWGVTVGTILFSAIGLLVVWLFVSLLPEISH